MNRKVLLAKVHIGKKQLKLSDAEYRALLLGQIQQDSCKQASIAELEKVIRRMNQPGASKVQSYQRKSKSKAKPDWRTKYINKLQKMWSLMHEAEVVDSADGLAAWFTRQTGVDAMQWAEQKQLSQAIEALKQWAFRAEVQAIMDFERQAKWKGMK